MSDDADITPHDTPTLPSVLPADEVRAAELVSALFDPRVPTSVETYDRARKKTAYERTHGPSLISTPLTNMGELLVAVDEMLADDARWALLRRYRSHQILDLHWRWHPNVPAQATGVMACPISDLARTLEQLVHE